MGQRTLNELLDYHLGLRPMLLAEDAYKLLFQGVFGNGHIITENDLGYLLQEIKLLEFDVKNPLTEVVSLDGSIIRVNLRPYIKAGNPPELLYKMMVASNRKRGTHDELVALWEQLIPIFPPAVAFKFPEGLPSHSAAYHNLYSPAYRVVSLDAFNEEDLKRVTKS